MSTITKKALADSLKRILLKKDIDKITIDEIAKETGVNRQTFYYHFNDIYDLVEWIYNSEILVGIQGLNNHDDWKKTLSTILNYIIKNKVFISKTYKLSSLNKFVYKSLYNNIYIFLNDSRHDNINKDEKQFMAKFYSIAFNGILEDWIENGMKQSSESLINNLEMVVNYKNRQF